jgi:hypothetical protein
MSLIRYLTHISALVLIGMLCHLAYTYMFTTGYGLHPVLAALGILFGLACSLIVELVYQGWYCSRFDMDMYGQEPVLDITNDIYANH